MIKAKDGDFSFQIGNRNTVEFSGIWEQIHSPVFNYGKFAIIRSQAGLNHYKISVKEWARKIIDGTNKIYDINCGFIFPYDMIYNYFPIRWTVGETFYDLQCNL